MSNNYGKITRAELHPSLIEFIQSQTGTGNGGSVKFIKNSVTLSSSSNEVSIGIDTFNKDRDLLLVYKNSVYLEDKEDYNISSDGRKITSINGNFSNGSVFNFIVLANCVELTDGLIDGTKLLSNSISINKLDRDLVEKINNLSNGNNNMDIDGGEFGDEESGNIIDGGDF